MIQDIKDIKPIPKKKSVGEEFIEWAEKYWALKQKYEQVININDESVPFDYIKDTFIKKIDDIIQNRLKPE